MCSKTKAQPSGMFLSGKDLPLFSGTPQRAQAEIFAPPVAATQATLPMMPPIEAPRRKPEDLRPIEELPMFEDMEEDLL